MANYLVAKCGNTTSSYSLRNTEPSKPYLKVSNSYLPLTTSTKTGLQVKVNNVKYNIQESYTTTVSSSSISTSTNIYIVQDTNDILTCYSNYYKHYYDKEKAYLNTDSYKFDIFSAIAPFVPVDRYTASIYTSVLTARSSNIFTDTFITKLFKNTPIIYSYLTNSSISTTKSSSNFASITTNTYSTSMYYNTSLSSILFLSSLVYYTENYTSEYRMINKYYLLSSSTESSSLNSYKASRTKRSYTFITTSNKIIVDFGWGVYNSYYQTTSSYRYTTGNANDFPYYTTTATRNVLSLISLATSTSTVYKTNTYSVATTSQ